MRQFFSFAFLSAISYLCHRVFDKSKWNTKDTAFKVDKSLPRLLPYAVCQIVRFDWNFCHQKVYTPRAKTAVNRRPKSGNNPGSPGWDRANETARQRPRKKAAPEEAARKYSILFNIRCRQKLYCSITFTRLACPLSFDMSLREP